MEGLLDCIDIFNESGKCVWIYVGDARASRAAGNETDLAPGAIMAPPRFRGTPAPDVGGSERIIITAR